MPAPIDPVDSPTLVALLRSRAERTPDSPAYTFLEDGEREVDQLTFAQLDQRARAIGRRVAEAAGGPGARVLLLYPSGLDFVAAFVGVMYGGGVAVPAPVGEPSQLARTLPRLRAIAGDSEPALILTTSEGKAVLDELVQDAPELRDLPVLATDGLDPAGAEGWADPGMGPDDLAFLQYTSGSTAAPKGVMVSHANLLYTAKDIDGGWHYDASSVLVSWLPIFHDMGLICGIVLPMFRGFHCYLMTPVAFVQKPLRWLAAMSKYGATHGAAPNFAYDLCVRKIGPGERAQLDLSHWVVTLNSAEPVRRETMERFTEAFGPCGFRMETFCPGFGLAEATVKVTASNRGDAPVFVNVRHADLGQDRIVPVDDEERGPGVVSLASNGAAILETRVVIADPEHHTPKGPLEIGEIWVAGPCVAQGYWKRPEETAHTFGARLAGSDGTWMRTGDLGFLDADGGLYCTGRIKDLVILRGRNFYPQDLERAAEESHPAVRPGCAAAFSLDADGEERLALVVEVDPRRDPDTGEVLRAVREAVSTEFEVQPWAVVLVPPRAVPKTSSGKVQRRGCRTAFLGLGLDVIGLELAREERTSRGDSAGAVVRRRVQAADAATKGHVVEFYLLSLLAPALAGVDPSTLDRTAPLVHGGLDLVVALEWMDTIEESLGVRLDPARFFSRITMQELAAWLLEELEQTADEPAAPEPSPASLAQASAAPPAPTAREIESWMIERIATRLSLDPLDVEVHRPFATLGLDSMMAVDLAMDLEDWLGRSLPSTFVWDYPTIETAARHLGGSGPAPAPEPAARSTQAPSQEPIAVVGLACRFPGAADVEAFWDLLQNKVDAIRETPEGRWNNDELYDPKPGRPGKLATRWGGFLDDVDLFEPAFFGIAAREASRMDPQQRILLETAWEALEHAGISPHALAGGRTGVFLGKSSRDYLRWQLAELEDIDGFASTGNASSVASGRINYVLDLHGPSMSIDTACSSSLVAMHQARRALLNGECDVALSGGVNLILTPHWTISFSHAHMMAPDGRCKTFDASANGYVRGEGCGMVVLKRLSDALRDHDNILATIRGSAVNHDGRSNGITAPNGPSQKEVIRAALADGDVDPASVGYVEAHGTGTPLGDPIEAQGLADVLGEGRPAGRPFKIGSVKTNVGHLEPAAGIAGFVKAALTLWKEEIPAQLHTTEVNPRIPIDELPLEIATESSPWRRDPGGLPRIAGVSSFGFSGTNAHVVLEEAPPAEPLGEDEDLPRVACLSARTPTALAAVAARLAEHLELHPELRLTDVAFTLNAGRAHLEQRAVIPFADRSELLASLSSLTGDTPSPTILRGTVPERRPEHLLTIVGTSAAAQECAERLRALGIPLQELAGTPPPPEEGQDPAALLLLDADAPPGTDEHPTLALTATDCADRAPLLRALAWAHCLGHPVTWDQIDADLPHRRAPLPTYPFERKPYWFKSKRKASRGKTPND